MSAQSRITSAASSEAAEAAITAALSPPRPAADHLPMLEVKLDLAARATDIRRGGRAGGARSAP